MTLHTRDEAEHPGWTLWMATTLGGAIALGGLVLVSTPTHDARETLSWQSCFESPAAALAAGPGRDAALENVQATHEEARRRASLHRSAVDRLLDDDRWNQQDQINEMTRAVKAEKETAELQEALAEDAMATAGCLENEH